MRSEKQRIHLKKLANYWRGKKHTEETKKKISEAGKGNRYHYGHKHTKEAKLKVSRANLGRKHSLEFKEKCRARMLGNKNLEGHVPWNKGMKGIGGWKLSVEERKRRSEKYKGENSHFWKGGITPINHLIRTSAEYDEWRKKVFKRDNYTCIWCGGKGGELNADHIKPFSLYLKLRFDINNGRTLCTSCHRQTDTYAGKIRLVSSFKEKNGETNNLGRIPTFLT